MTSKELYDQLVSKYGGAISSASITDHWKYLTDKTQTWEVTVFFYDSENVRSGRGETQEEAIKDVESKLNAILTI